MELADLIRLGAPVPPGELYICVVKEFERGTIEFGGILPLYRHAMCHANRDLARCPVCRSPL